MEERGGAEGRGRPSEGQRVGEEEEGAEVFSACSLQDQRPGATTAAHEDPGEVGEKDGTRAVALGSGTPLV